MNKFEELLSSHKMRATIAVFGFLFLGFLIFHAGVEIGEHRSAFGPRDADRDFRHPLLPPGVSLPHEFAPNDHGAVGTVTSVALPTLTIQTPDGTSQTILVSSSTVVRNMGSPNSESFSVGDNIVVLGEPDAQNRIDAKFVRIIPSTPPPPLP